MSTRRHDRNLREVRLLFPHASPAKSAQRFAPDIEDAIRIVHPAIPWLPRRVNILPPAVATEFDFIPVDNAEWKIISVTAVLTTDANVANRTVSVQLQDAGSPGGRFTSPSVQPASTAFRYTFAVGVAEKALALTNLIVLSIPIGIVLVGPGRGVGFELRLRSITDNIQAGDQWGAVDAFVLERLRVAFR